MKTTKIFTHEIDDLGRDWGMADSRYRLNDWLDEAIADVNETRLLGPDYAEENPELVAGIVIATVLDYNARLLIKTLQDGLAAIVAEIGRAKA